MSFQGPSYDPPLGQEFGDAPSDAFSGKPESGPLAEGSGSQGAIFFSPALLEENLGNEIDVDSIDVAAASADTYVQLSGANERVFTWGPNSPARTNDFDYRTQPGHYTATATLVQTIPPGPTTVIKIP